MTANELRRWKPVVGWEGAYAVSDDGQVRSLARTLPDGRHWKERTLSLVTTESGHVAVNLARPKRLRLVHQLVLEAFVGPRPSGLEGLHRNDVPDDNRLTNLRWGTRSENLLDSVRNGHHSWANRTHCRHNHVLEAPNLLASDLARDNRRRCLACNRARRSLAARGLPFDVTIADLNYSRIMKEEPHVFPS